jgi:hypothetical protein
MPSGLRQLADVSGVHAAPQREHDGAVGRALPCGRCGCVLECVEQNRRLGTWLGSFLCPNCRSEYFYAYRWGRLLTKTG